MINILYVALFLFWTLMYGAGLVVLIHFLDLPYSLCVPISLFPAAILALGSVSLFARMVNYCKDSQAHEAQGWEQSL